MLPRRSLLLLGATLLVACDDSGQPEQGPAQVVQEFVERMQRVHGDREKARAAYDLMWSRDRKVLQERARRASAVAGRELGPEEMLAPSRFGLRFSPQRYEVTERTGKRAKIAVHGPHAGQVAHITCVFEPEERAWRVVLNLPEPPPIRKRPREVTPDDSP